jgi:hypothetical protein
MTTVESVAQPRGGRWFWAAWGAAFVGFPIGGVAAAATVGPVDTIARPRWPGW